MKPFERAHIPESEVQLVIESTMKMWQDGSPEIRSLFEGVSDPTTARAAIEGSVRRQVAQDEVWANDLYQVNVRRMEGLVHLSIKRLDRECIHDWRQLQEIKSKIVGPECEGVELYPAESRVVDQANQFHIWCIADPTYRFPFGFIGGRFVSKDSLGKSVQRPFEE